MTWSSAARRFPPGRYAIVEPIGLAVHDWSRPADGQPRMFDQPFLEWFTRVHPASLAVIYAPATVAFFAYGVSQGIPLGTAIALFAGGVGLWTFFEYVLHRFWFHFTPRGKISVFLTYMIHGVHHAFPEDDRRWLVPPIVSVPVAVVLFYMYRLVAGRWFAPIAAGSLLGYLCYDLFHYAIHRGPSRWRVINALRKHHLQHHYSVPERWFGGSTPLWDYVFRTSR